MATPSRERTYWICQLVGWGFYGILNFALLAANGFARPAVLATAFAPSVIGALTTHLFRALLRRRGWLALRPRALVPRVVVACVLQAATVLAGVVAVTALVAPERLARITLVGSLVWLGNFSILFHGWSLFYVGVHFFERSRRAEVAQLRQEAALRTAELRSLKAQVNPHFLFNCLNSLRALIDEDPERARMVVTRLASLLRYSLGAASAETVPLERELAVVEDYLALEAVRFEERLRVQRDVDAATLAVPVPVMLLQTLVENAIKHGVAQREGGGEIVVTARIEGAALRLEVANTAAAGPSRAPGEGVGLANATERLHLLFGDGASLELDRSSTETTVARVRIPIA